MKTIILCGGSGTRLWPLSQDYRPKQFVKIIHNESLFELTLKRNQSMSNNFIIVVNAKQVELAKAQLHNFQSKILVEGVGRNTAPAIALACLNVDPEEIVLIVPSDHLILNQKEYEKCIQQAIELANNDKLVTFGIKPTHPETGYGYIQSKGDKVISFKEKPNLETAIDYLKDGNYLWNSGMFCFKAKTFLEELKEHSPQIFQEALSIHQKTHDSQEIFYSEKDLLKIPSDSIDYAVMEKSQNVCVVPADIGWSDLGSYDSLYENTEKEKNNAIICSEADILCHESEGNLIIGDKKQIATFNVNDLIIVDSPEGILVGKRGFSQNVKIIQSKIK